MMKQAIFLAALMCSSATVLGMNVPHDSQYSSDSSSSSSSLEIARFSDCISDVASVDVDDIDNCSTGVNVSDDDSDSMLALSQKEQIEQVTNDISKIREDLRTTSQQHLQSWLSKRKTAEALVEKLEQRLRSILMEEKEIRRQLKSAKEAKRDADDVVKVLMRQFRKEAAGCSEPKPKTDKGKASCSEPKPKTGLGDQPDGMVSRMNLASDSGSYCTAKDGNNSDVINSGSDSSDIISSGSDSSDIISSSSDSSDITSSGSDSSDESSSDSDSSSNVRGSEEFSRKQKPLSESNFVKFSHLRRRNGLRSSDFPIDDASKSKDGPFRYVIKYKDKIYSEHLYFDTKAEAMESIFGVVYRDLKNQLEGETDSENSFPGECILFPE